MRVFPSSMATSSTSSCAASHEPFAPRRMRVNHGRDPTSETVGCVDEHFDGDRSVYRGFLSGATNVSCGRLVRTDRKSTRLNSSHTVISYAVFCLKKKK